MWCPKPSPIQQTSGPISTSWISSPPTGKSSSSSTSMSATGWGCPRDLVDRQPDRLHGASTRGLQVGHCQGHLLDHPGAQSSQRRSIAVERRRRHYQPPSASRTAHGHRGGRPHYRGPSRQAYLHEGTWDGIGDWAGSALVDRPRHGRTCTGSSIAEPRSPNSHRKGNHE